MRDLLPTELYLAADVRAIDAAAIERFKIPGTELMDRAARAALAVLRQRWPDAQRVLVLCGTGNNAGDGYLLALHALRAGLQATVAAVSPPDELRGDASTAWMRAREAGVPIGAFAVGHPLMGDPDLIVDAIFGTGLNRPLSGTFAAAVDALNESAAPVLALDIPSGLAADSGAILGAAVRADATITFVALKQGMFTGQARACCGDISFCDLAIPAAARDGAPVSARRVRLEDFSELLAPRVRTAHKGHFGHALMLGGNLGYGGAIRLAALAAARSGAGLVSVGTHPDNALAASLAAPELMVRSVAEPIDLAPLLERATVVAIGPGLGQDEWAQRMLGAVLEWRGPTVCDADALNLIAREPALASAFPAGQYVFTPHPAEAGRLLGLSAAQVEADRFAALRSLLNRYEGTVVLKGAGSLIGTKSGRVAVCTAGNPGMASGGMGDVLTGIIAGLMAQGLDASSAAAAGVCAHAEAGDLAAVHGERGLLAGDLVRQLRRVLNDQPR